MCPVCEEPLVVFELEGVEVDRCLQCGGTWLDSGELEELDERAGILDGRLSKALHASGAKHGKRRCVRCRGKLRIAMIDQVEIDHCPYGHGMWLDKGEMKTLISTFDQNEEGVVAKFFGDLYKTELKVL